MLRRANALLFILIYVIINNRIGDTMKNNKGFISMSLVYSFLLVFVAISIALLSIYTENIADIRKLNTEIKDDLIERGNDQIIVLKNLIVNGSFEEFNEHPVTDYWYNTANCKFSTRTTKTVKINNVDTILQEGQAYYGSGSIEINTDGTPCQFTSKNAIRMEQYHVYYVEILYNAGDGYGDKDTANAHTNLYFVNNYDANPSTSNIITSVTNIRAAKDFGAGWTMPTGTPGTNFDMGTVRADIFRFTRASGDYYIGLRFDDTTEKQPMYMDGFMLIDITAAIGKDKASQLCDDTDYPKETPPTTTPGASCSNNNTYAEKIWRLKARKMQVTPTSPIVYGNDGYYEGRKVFSAHDADSIK